MGWIPDIAEAVVEEHPTPCRCGGAGFVKASTGPRLSDWVATPCPCQDRAA